MLESSTSCIKINRSQLNKSPSKHIYPFSRQPRFRNKTQSLTYRSDYINFPGIADNVKNKGLSFTKSKKQLKFQNQEEDNTHPAPNIYQQELTKHKSIGFSIGKRFKTSLTPQQKTPGPAAYNKNLSSSRSSISFSREQRKLKYPIANCKGQNTPGPYLIEVQRVQKILSKYKSSREIKIKNISTKNPQNINSRLLKHQKSIIEKMRKKPLRSNNIKQSHNSSLIQPRSSIIFGKAPKKSCFDVNLKQKNPGPANYESFTEFAQRNKPKLIKSPTKILRNQKEKKNDSLQKKQLNKRQRHKKDNQTKV